MPPSSGIPGVRQWFGQKENTLYVENLKIIIKLTQCWSALGVKYALSTPASFFISVSSMKLRQATTFWIGFYHFLSLGPTSLLVTTSFFTSPISVACSLSLPLLSSLLTTTQLFLMLYFCCLRTVFVNHNSSAILHCLWPSTSLSKKTIIFPSWYS